MSLDFGFTSEQEQLRSVVRAFVGRELTRDFLREIDASGRAPHELLPKMAALGFNGLPVPTQYGGSGGSATDVSVLLEEVGRASLSIASLLNRALGWGAEAILRFGTEDQKRYFLPRVCAGEMIFAFSHTEADAGSDAAAIRTRAVADGDHFVIDGTKMITTGAGECPCLIVTARTDANAPKHHGLSVFLVDATTPGIACHKIEKLGMRGAGGLYEVQYQSVRVPRSSLLGTVNGGWQVITSTLERARIAQAAYCVGAAQKAVDDAVRYANERSQFGQPIGKFQAVQFKLVDMLAQIEAARAYTYHVAALADQGKDITTAAALAKLVAADGCHDVCNKALNIFGGYGLMNEFPAQRFLRDSYFTIIGGGTSDIMRLIVARQIGL